MPAVLPPIRFPNLFSNSVEDIAKKIFMDEVFNPMDPAMRDMLDCDNLNQGGVGIVTYYKSNCISYFSALYNTPSGEYELVIREIKCAGTSCCREAWHVCYDFVNNQPKGTPNYSDSGEPCQAGPLPTIPSGWKTGSIWWYQSDCESGCGVE